MVTQTGRGNLERGWSATGPAEREDPGENWVFKETIEVVGRVLGTGTEESENTLDSIVRDGLVRSRVI